MPWRALMTRNNFGIAASKGHGVIYGVLFDNICSAIFIVGKVGKEHEIFVKD